MIEKATPPAAPAHATPLLSVSDLAVEFRIESGTLRAVDGLSFDLREGETLGVAGESGCGKSVTALSVMRLVQHPGRVAGGRILFDGRDLLTLSEREMRTMRGRSMAMVFQEPMTALNPLFTIGTQLAEVLMVHRGMGRADALAESAEALETVGIPEPGARLRSYPHQLSGGQRQRAMIAMALLCRPRLLIADEPTTALDVTVQAQIMQLLRELGGRLATSIMLITHDLAVLAEMADRVLVMYAGVAMELAPAAALFEDPKHPYTRGLLECLPSLAEPGRKLRVIEGTVPDPAAMPAACRFHPRCPLAEDICRRTAPDWRELAPGHWARCHLAE